jgi:hypothetical protein
MQMFHYNTQNLSVKHTAWFCSLAMLTGHGQQMYLFADACHHYCVSVMRTGSLIGIKMSLYALSHSVLLFFV